ncbi:MAG: diguanylate cyclase [Solirubrobacteraceae bacterium]
MRDQPDRSYADGTAAERLARAARAAQQLCDVLWEALHEELRHPNAERITQLSERLAEVSSTVAMLAAAAPRAAATAAPDMGVPDTAVRDTAAPPTAAPDAPALERRTPPEPSRPDPPPPLALQPIPTRAGEYKFTKLVDEQDQTAPGEPLAPVQPIQPEIEIRDVRREEGPSAWVSSVGRLLQRHAEDGLPFAVLLVEIVDVARLERSETSHDMHGLVAQVESALGQGMRASDRLSRETLGRYWLVAPETNGTGARMLAERLARLVRTSASHRGVPLEVAIGIAVCPEDGTEAPALAARADLGVYSARATGRSIAHTDPPA